MNRGRAAVVGSGFGGLAVAIRLQSQGIPTVLFEGRDKLGGRAYVYEDKGFTFDAGPTVITAPQVLTELFEGAGKKLGDYVTLLPVSPFYRLLWDDGYQFDYGGEAEAIDRQIRLKSPEDVAGYHQFLAYSQEVFKEGYEKLVHVPFTSFWDMVKVAPQLARLRADRSVYKTVSRFIKDKHLREAFSFHSLLVGGNPFSTSSIYTLIHYLERNWGVWFPLGGTGALVRALGKLFVELGGEIRLNSPVDQILTDRKKVVGIQTRAGQKEFFSIVVSNADVVHTYKHLLRNHPVGVSRARRLERKAHSMSLFLIYFGTNKKYPDLAHHTILFGPRYKELLDDVFHYGYLADDFSLYLHMPTKTDPALAPEGCEGFYVLSPVPHLGKLNCDWSAIGPKYADKILTYLEKKCLPGLRKHLVTQRIFTPTDFKVELNAHFGSAFSVEPRLSQSAYFRPHNAEKALQGLYFVGAGTHPGAGLPGVINSAKATAGLILQDFEPRPASLSLVEAPCPT